MEQLYLMPGQERCEKFRDPNGVPKVRYSYCSLHGALFHCVSRSVEEAQRLCEDWLVGQAAATATEEQKRTPGAHDLHSGRSSAFSR